MQLFKTIIFSIIILTTLVSCDQRAPLDFDVYFGTWESTDSIQLKIKIEPFVAEGKVIEKRYSVSIVDKSIVQKLPEFYLPEGSYSFDVGPTKKEREKLEKENETVMKGLPRFLVKPFEQSIFSPRYQRLTFIGKVDENTLQRVSKGLPNVTFVRISND